MILKRFASFQVHKSSNNITLYDSSRSDDDDRKLDDYLFSLMGDPKRQAMQILSYRNAAAVALGSTKSLISSLISSNVKDHSSLAREARELESHILLAEHTFLDKVTTEMNENDKREFLYDLLDKDGNGVDFQELLNSLRNFKDLKAIKSIVSTMENLLGAYKRRLSFEEFEDVLTKVSYATDSSTGGLSQVIIQFVTFQSGRAILENYVQNLKNERDTEDLFMRRVYQARMLILFDALDYYHNGRVLRKDVVKHLSRVADHGLDLTQRRGLLAVDSKEKRQLKFIEFIELLESILQSTIQPIYFHNLLNAMTLSICDQNISDSAIQSLFSHHDNFTQSLIQRTDEPILHGMLPCGKLERLFNLLDSTNDGFLDLTEVALFIKKSKTKSNSLDTAIKEATDSILAFDSSHDMRLDQREFSELIMRLAYVSGIPLPKFVDYLVLNNVLKADDEYDLEYMKSHSKDFLTITSTL
jgi:Ca2+-binding EF-hand superfamily protein